MCFPVFFPTQLQITQVSVGSAALEGKCFINLNPEDIWPISQRESKKWQLSQEQEFHSTHALETVQVLILSEVTSTLYESFLGLLIETGSQLHHVSIFVCH